MYRILAFICFFSASSSLGASPDNFVASYISANGDGLSFRRSANEWAVCPGHTCSIMPRCDNDQFHCIDIDGARLAVPRNIWRRLPPTIECNENQALSWEYGEYTYKARLPYRTRGTCGSPLMQPIRVMNREFMAISVDVLASGQEDESTPAVSFLYSPDYGVVAIDFPFSNGKGETIFRSFFLEGKVGILRAEK